MDSWAMGRGSNGGVGVEGAGPVVLVGGRAGPTVATDCLRLYGLGL
jgi:hypothetical protein